jgi:hypothetical protein
MSTPHLEPPELDVPQVLAHDWINRHGTFRPTPARAERTGTNWGMVITEAARWGQRQGWDARPEQPAPAADVAPLLWVLWHHMGGNSPVGQPIRKYLGMGQFERMSKEQVKAAKGWGSIPFQVAPANTIAECGGPCEEDFRLCDCGLLQQLNPQRPPATTTEPRFAGLIERVAEAMGPQTQAAQEAGELPYSTARAAIREVAEWLEEQENDLYQLGDALNLLEQEANRD